MPRRCLGQKTKLIGWLDGSVACQILVVYLKLKNIKTEKYAKNYIVSKNLMLIIICKQM